MKWLILFILPALGFSLKMIPGLQRCNNEDMPCLKDAIQDALQKMAKGVPEPYNIQSLDPLLVDEFNVSVGSNAIQMNQYLKNTTVVGISSMRINKVKFDWKKNILSMKASFDKLIFSGLYTLDGKFLVFPVQGSGPFTIEFYNGTIDLLMDWDIVTKDNEKYMKIKNVRTPFQPTLVTLNFENLFGGNKLLSDNMNAVFNENWKVILDDVAPYYFQAYNANLKRSIEAVVEQMSLQEIFVDFKN